MSSDVQYTILAFIIIAALSLLVQVVGVIAVLMVARKAAKNLREEIEHYRSTLTPILEKTREVVHNVAPKVESAAAEFSVISTRLREQTAEFQSAASDIISRTQNQASRVDHMLTAIFDRVERAGTFVSGAVSKPMRQVSGVIASIKAAVDTLRDPAAGRPRASRGTSRYANGEEFGTAHAAPPSSDTSAPFRP